MEVPSRANGGISADGLTYTFHLRSGVTFSDGTALNSSVVKRSIDRVMRLNLDGSAAFPLYDVGALRADHLPGDSAPGVIDTPDRKSTRPNPSHRTISYAGFCLQH